MRDTTIFYRSFYESIKELQPEEQAQLYTAIFEYSLNFNEVELNGVCKTIFTLIKPIIDANNKRYLNGKKPKTKQEESKPEAKPKQEVSETEANKNKDNNNNEDKDMGKEVITHPFIDYIKTNCPNVAKMKSMLTIQEADRLVEEFDKTILADIVNSMDNYADLNKKYISTNKTIRAWIKLRKERNPEPIVKRPNMDGLTLN